MSTKPKMGIVEFFEVILGVTNLSPSQKIALKAIRGESLDLDNPIEKSHPYQDKDFENELEMFKHFSGKDSHDTQAYSDVSLAWGRRSGKTQLNQSLIQLADGSVNVVGDLVGEAVDIIAWDKDTKEYIKTKANVVDNGIKPCSKIKTRYGHILDRTDNHPLYTVEGWKSVDASFSPDIGQMPELKVGDRIAVPINNPIEGQTSQDADMVKLLAYFLADGSLVNNSLTYTLYNKPQREEIENIFNSMGAKYSINDKKGTEAKELRLAVDNKFTKLVKELELIGTKSDTKFIPNWVYRLPNDQVALFLNRLMATDGWACVSKGKKAKAEVGFCSASSNLSYGVKRLLARLGIVSNIHKSKAGYKKKGVYKQCRDRFSVIIENNSEIAKFIKKVGLYGKGDKLNELTDYLGPNAFNSQLDTMPVSFCTAFSKKLATLMTYRAQEAKYGRIRANRCASKERLLKYAEMFPEEFKEERDTLNMDFYWDEITDIESMGDQPTAGLEVPVYHTYINDVLEHNSTTIGAGLLLYYATQFDYTTYLGTSPHATIPLISPTKEQAGEVYASVLQFCMKSGYIFQNFLGGNISNVNQEYTQDDMEDPSKITGGTIKLSNKVHIKVMAADVSKIRGIAVPFAILDECCWFGVDGNDTKNTDKGIFEALAPALSQFQTVEGMALILKISSPNGQAGLMFEDFENKKDTDTLHMQIPSWYANPTISIKYLEKQKKKGMGYFNREYGAQYTASEQSFLDPDLIEKAILKGTEQIPKQKGYVYVAAMDYATKDDYWAFGIGHKEYITDPESKQKREKVVIDFAKAWRGTSGAELDPDEIVGEICSYMKEYGAIRCVSDQYAFAPLRHLFLKNGCVLKEFKVSTTSKVQYMLSLQVALNTEVLQIVDHPLTIRHLKDLREKRSNISNKIKIEHASNCLIPGTLVKTLKGYKPIENLKVGTLVLTHEGRYRPITKTYKTKIKDNINILKSHGFIPIHITKEHPILMGKAHRITRNVKALEWRDTKSLAHDDRLVGMANYVDTREDSDYITYDNFNFKNNSEFARLMGYFVGDGHAVDRNLSIKSGYRISMSVSKTESHIKRWISKVLKNMDIRHYTLNSKGCWVIQFNHKAFWKLASECYNENREKVMPKWALTYKIDDKAFIQGWLLADGSVEHNRRIGVTISKALACDIVDIAWRLGLYCTIREVPRKRYEVKTKTQYWVAFNKYSDRSWVKKLPCDEMYKGSRLKTIETPYEGYVYNIEVLEDNSYIANNAVLHNCKDDAADVVGLIAYQFDKSSPLYISTYKETTKPKPETKDLTGKYIATPTAEQLAQQAGIKHFYDNTEELEAKKEDEESGEDLSNDSNFWFSF